jgi:hypothetical protein
MKIPFNNSSLDYLGCSRRYVYRVIMGAVEPPKIEFQYGKLFHRFMQEIDDTDIAIFMQGPMCSPKWSTPDILALKANVPPNMQLALAVLACATRDKLQPDINNGIREGFFTTKFPTDAGVPDELDPCGTVDLENYHESSRCVVLTDYKTTHKPITADLILSYRLKSQLFFYAVCHVFKRKLNPRLNSELMDKIYDAIVNGRIMRRYVIVSYKDPTSDKAIYVDTPELIHQDVFDEFYRLMIEKAHLAKFLWEHPETSTKEGMATNGCFFCPFKTVCALHNPLAEKDAIKKWQYGFKPYDPETF